MTITYPAPTGLTPVDVERVVLDLYRDVHKGIRAEMFDVTEALGRVDPADHTAREAVATRVHALAALLVSHAEHEDAAIQPALERELPELAERIASDHAAIDARIDDLRCLADATATAPADHRFGVHRLYLDLAAFTGAYLEHQDVEERVVMPALEAAVGVEAVVGIHQAIIGSIPPDEMASALAVMLPAMNVDDRAELLGGMRAGAPAEVFEGVWGLAGSVLAPADHAALAARLGLA